MKDRHEYKTYSDDEFKFPGQKIKMLRKKMGYNQREFAFKAQMSPSALNRIESGQSIQPRRIVSIAEIFGIHPRELDFSPKVANDDAVENLNLMKKLFPNWKEIIKEGHKEIK